MATGGCVPVCCGLQVKRTSKTQPVRYTSFAQGVRGCLSIEWSADSRRDAADCTVTALARRWSVVPGDVVQIMNEGPADGLWLVKVHPPVD